MAPAKKVSGYLHTYPLVKHDKRLKRSVYGVEQIVAASRDHSQSLQLEEIKKQTTFVALLLIIIIILCSYFEFNLLFNMVKISGA